MEEEEVGKYYVSEENGELYQFLSYCGTPTATMMNVNTKERVRGAVGSPILKPFKKLVLEGNHLVR